MTGDRARRQGSRVSRPLSPRSLVVSPWRLVLVSIGGGVEGTSRRRRRTSEVQSVFDRTAAPAAIPASTRRSTSQRRTRTTTSSASQALEDPTLYRVVAGDPGRSFLYLKVGGDPADRGHPGDRDAHAAAGAADRRGGHRRTSATGSSGREGRRRRDGRPRGDDAGNRRRRASATRRVATQQSGTGTITGHGDRPGARADRGRARDAAAAGAGARGRRGALPRRRDRRDGTIHARRRPGRPLPAQGLRAEHDLRLAHRRARKRARRRRSSSGFPNRVVPNPTISKPTVDRPRARRWTCRATNLDGNYTLAVNPGAGLVFELAQPGQRARALVGDDRPGASRAVGLHGGGRDSATSPSSSPSAADRGRSRSSRHAAVGAIVAARGRRRRAALRVATCSRSSTPSASPCHPVALPVPRPAARAARTTTSSASPPRRSPRSSASLPGRPELSYLLTHPPDPSLRRPAHLRRQAHDRSVDPRRGEG